MSRVIVITGAGSGLGRALARRFAAEGEAVVLLGRTLSKLQAVADEIGGRAMAVSCDVSSPASVREAFSTIAKRHAQLDVLINNAAIFMPSPMPNVEDDLIVQIINTNLTGAILCMRAALPMMQPGGHIINVSSESVDMPFPQLGLYQASKAGLERFTMGLHHDLEPTGIRVSVVRAGAMLDEGFQISGDPEVWNAFFEAAQSRGLNLLTRPGTPYEKATAIFRALIDLPPELHVIMVAAHARAANEEPDSHPPGV